MDILYIVKNSAANNMELKCSLRSIEQFGKNVGKIYVCGYCPEWLSDEVVKIPCEDKYQGEELTQNQKNANICYKLLYAVDHSDIGDTFMVSMDDHFYVRDTDFETYPYFVRKRKKYGRKLPKDDTSTSYMKYLSDVRNYLESKNLPILDFALHRNRRINRQDIEECREVLEDTINNCIPSGVMVYLSNYRYSKEKFEYQLVKDVKLSDGGQWWKTDDRETEVFSTGDFTEKDGLYVLLQGLYPNKSKYEIWLQQ